MRAVLADLESMTAADPRQELTAELAAARDQLHEMLAKLAASDEDPDDDDPDDEDE